MRDAFIALKFCSCIVHTNPNPDAFSIAAVNRSFNFSSELYSGSKSRPKHVKAVGNLSESGPFL